MKNKKLIIGRIPYANLFPVFYYLDRECRNPAYKFVKGVPSQLNKMLREGMVDISPSSSIEYLRNKDKYLLVPYSSISSEGPIKSIFLFSKCPIAELGGKTIALSSASEASTALLKIILGEFFSLKCRFESTDLRSVRNVLSTSSAVLHIGDTAMKEAKKTVTSHKLQVTSKTAPPGATSSLFIYDLGELWYRHTGLPFVFALWVVRKEALAKKRGLIENLTSDLIAARKYTRKNFSMIAAEAPQKKWLDEKELVAYWKTISYDFTEKHLEGLRLFEKYAKKSART